jgi:hypothetical protein
MQGGVRFVERAERLAIFRVDFLNPEASRGPVEEVVRDGAEFCDFESAPRLIGGPPDALADGEGPEGGVQEVSEELGLAGGIEPEGMAPLSGEGVRWVVRIDSGDVDFIAQDGEFPRVELALNVGIGEDLVPVDGEEIASIAAFRAALLALPLDHETKL